MKSTEKDDDYIVLCHHWNRWLFLSLQLLLIKVRHKCCIYAKHCILCPQSLPTSETLSFLCCFQENGFKQEVEDILMYSSITPFSVIWINIENKKLTMSLLCAYPAIELRKTNVSFSIWSVWKRGKATKCLDIFFSLFLTQNQMAQHVTFNHFGPFWSTRTPPGGWHTDQPFHLNLLERWGKNEYYKGRKTCFNVNACIWLYTVLTQRSTCIYCTVLWS